jgi:integrase
LEIAQDAQQKIALPRVEKFNAMNAEMCAGRSRDSINCADFAAGLAFPERRVGEAREIAWRDVDFQSSEIVVIVGATTGPNHLSQ